MCPEKPGNLQNFNFKSAAAAILLEGRSRFKVTCLNRPSVSLASGANPFQLPSLAFSGLASGRGRFDFRRFHARLAQEKNSSSLTRTSKDMAKAQTHVLRINEAGPPRCVAFL